MTTDTREIEDRLRKWHGLYFAEAGPEEPMMMEFLRDVHLAADALSAARKREEELSKLVHMPGMWHCAKCNFTLMQSNLNALDGSITARDNPGDKCPNDGSPLWRVSYRQAYKEMMEIAEQAQVRHRAREEALMAVVAAMSEALAPFAAYADKDRALSDRPSNMGMQVTTGALYMVPQITMGDCYRARQALSLAQLDGGA